MLMLHRAKFQVHLSKVQLKDRQLFSDGDSVVSPEQILSLLSSGTNSEGIFVEQLTDEIIQFNKFVSKNEQIVVKKSTSSNDLSWNLPQEYAELDPIEHVIDEFNRVMVIEGRENPYHGRAERLAFELELYKEMNLLPVLCVLIYIINTLRKNNIVWGVGRGSSVSSYVLYIIGVHDVDSVEYDLDIKDFLRA